MTRFFKLMILATVLAVLALFVVACGGDDDAETTTTVSADSATTEAADTTTTEAAESTTTTAAETTTTAAQTTTTAKATTTTAKATTTTTKQSSPSASLLDVINGQSSLSTLAKAISTLGLEQRLADPDAELTIFAPNDDAFKAALSDWGVTLDQLLTFPDLKMVVSYHLVPEVVTRGDINAVGLEQIKVDTLANTSLVISVSDSGDIYVGDDKAKVIKADVEVSNGVIHIIDGVLTPPGLDF